MLKSVEQIKKCCEMGVKLTFRIQTSKVHYKILKFRQLQSSHSFSSISPSQSPDSSHLREDLHQHSSVCALPQHIKAKREVKIFFKRNLCTYHYSQHTFKRNIAVNDMRGNFSAFPFRSLRINLPPKYLHSDWDDGKE
jgi:hypothetical protein